MKMKIVIMALAAILTTGLLNSANARPYFHPARPHIGLRIVVPPIFRPPVVVFGSPGYYRSYPRYRSYGYYDRGYYDRDYRHGYGHSRGGWR